MTHLGLERRDLRCGYLGHLDAAFRDPASPYFLGRHWPPDTPENMFKPVPGAPSMVVPYFDPRVRIPLSEAALGDELGWRVEPWVPAGLRAPPSITVSRAARPAPEGRETHKATRQRNPSRSSAGE